MKKLIFLSVLCLSSFFLKGQDTVGVPYTTVHEASIIIQPSYQLFAPHTKIDSFLIIKNDTIYNFVNDTTGFVSLIGKKYVPTLNFLTKYVAGHSGSGGSDDSVHVKSTADTFLVNERVIFSKEDSSYIQATIGSNYGLQLYSGTSNIWLNNESDKIYFRSDSGIYFAVNQIDANAYIYDGTYFRNNTDSLADLSTVRSLIATGGSAENDPIFTASPSYSITNSDISNWDNLADSAVDQISVNTITDNGAGEVTISGSDFTTELGNDLTLYGRVIDIGNTNTGIFQINNTANSILFYDQRSVGNQKGIQYYADYVDLTGLSLVHRDYVSEMISDSANAGGWADNSGDTAKFNFLLSKNKSIGLITSNDNNLNVAAKGLLELSGEDGNNRLRLGTNLYYFYSPGGDPFTFYNGSYFYMNNGIFRTPTDTAAWLSDVRDLISTSSGLVPTDNILEWYETGNYYRPYTVRSAGVLYTGSSNPINTNLLKYDGNFRSTTLIGTALNVGVITAIDAGSEFTINDNVYLQDNIVSRTIRGGEWQIKFNANTENYLELANELDGFGTPANRESIKLSDDTIKIAVNKDTLYQFTSSGLILPDSSKLVTAGAVPMPTWKPNTPSFLLYNNDPDSNLTWIPLEQDVLNTTWTPTGSSIYMLLYNPVDSADNLVWVPMEEDVGVYNRLVIGTQNDTIVIDSTIKQYYNSSKIFETTINGYLYVNSNYNTVLGYNSLQNRTTAQSCVLLGYNAGSAITSGLSEVFIGRDAGLKTTTGGWNTFIGQYSGYENLTGQQNTFIGYASGQNNTGNFNTALGGSAGQNNTTGENNLFLGRFSGNNNTTQSNRIYINTLNRSNILGDSTKSPIYIFQNTNTSDQKIYLNGNVYTKHNLVEGVGTIADNDATPDVTGASTWTYNGTANAVVITDLDNPIPGEYYTIIGNSDTYTITINDSGNFNTSGSIVLGADDVVIIYVQADNDYIQASPVVDN